jgi:HEAT repeat protein
MTKAGKKQKHWGWIISISLCLLAFMIGCQKEITEEEVWLRIREIEALGKTKSEKDIDRLIKIFNDEDEQLYPYRHTAAITLAKLKSEKALNIFMQALKNKGMDTQLVIIEALGEMKTDKA